MGDCLGIAGRAILRQLTPALVLRLIRSALISLTIQLTTLAAYVVIGRSLAPQIDYAPLAAAATVIMFAASLPIGLGGWGMREMSAVVVLQTVGLPGASALLLALLVGVLSVSVVGAAALLLMVRGSQRDTLAPATPAAAKIPDYTVLLDWLVPLAAASAVFFQIHVPAGQGHLSVNLADPVVLVGVALFLLRQFCAGWPEWRVPALNAYLIAASAVIALSFLHGLAAFGWIDWAFTNRLLGWGMLLCYVATGALISLRAGEDGLETLLAALAATGAAIAAVEWSLTTLFGLGLDALKGIVDIRASGFSQNPNAFAFVLLLALAAALSLQDRLRWRTAVIAVIFAGLALAGSRASFVAIPIMLVLALVSGIKLRPIAQAALGAALLVGIVTAIFAWGPAGRGPQWVLLQFNSDNQHWETLVKGMQMFRANPIFGAGLGAYMHKEIVETGNPLVIHSTVVSLLAETGLAGVAVFAYAGWKIFAAEFGRRYDLAARVTILALAGFGVMAQAHDLLYQRALWLVLGAALALAIPRGNERRQSP